MIIQKKDPVPFDVSPYNCIQYEQTEAGFQYLINRLTRLLATVEKWRYHPTNPTNPVQQFKPFNSLIPRSELRPLEQALEEKDQLLEQKISLLEQKEKQLKKSVPREEYLAIEKELGSVRVQLKNVRSNSAARLQELQQAPAKIEAENRALRKQLEPSPPEPEKREVSPAAKLRSKALERLSEEETAKMIKQYDFYCAEL